MDQSLPTFQPTASNTSDDAGLGVLKTSRGCLPLTDMDVSSRISGLTYQTDVVQTFVNSLDNSLEATYIFPLPDRAAVTSFEFCVRDRVIKGVLKERGQARQEYREAIVQGKQAAMAEEDRSGVFTMQVGNLPPGEKATVRLKMVGPMELYNGEAEFRFPLVVAPRYTEGAALPGKPVGKGTATDTHSVPDASRISPPVLLPGLPNPVRLKLAVQIDDAGRPPGEDWKGKVRSSLHSLVASGDGPLTVSLQPGERLNRDFILRIPSCQPDVAASLQLSPVTKADDKAVDKTDQQLAGVMALTITPPALPETAPPPRDVVFLLDRSGSMEGWKMVAARRALARMVDALGDEDRFSVLAFDSVLEHSPATTGGSQSPELTPAGNRQRWRTLEWLGKIEARGGTQMSTALSAALKLLEGASGNRQPLVVLVTDGQVSGEDMLLKTLTGSSVSPRVYALGIDRAVNAGFLRKLAGATGGQADFVESEDRLDEAMNAMHRQLGAPVLKDIRIEPLNIDVVASSHAPVRTPDLFPHRAVTIYARHLSEGAARLKISATTATGEPWTCEVEANPQANPSLLHFWGRQKVRQLEDDYAVSREDTLREMIVRTSLEAGVLSRFTAFVAVDESEVVNAGGDNQQIVQPVEQVDGWGMERGCMTIDAMAAEGATYRASGGLPAGAARSGKRRMAKLSRSEGANKPLADQPPEPQPALPATPMRTGSMPRETKKRKSIPGRGRSQDTAWRIIAARLMKLLGSHSAEHFRSGSNWQEPLKLLHRLQQHLTRAGHDLAAEVAKMVSDLDTAVATAGEDAAVSDEHYTAITQLLQKLLLLEEARSEFWK